MRHAITGHLSNANIIATIAIATLFLCTSSSIAEERTLLILHTNDLHDHVRADYDGAGGLAYVSGYVDSVRAGRDDVLLLDAGDVMEKGDLVAFETKSRIMYEAMGRIGFDAAAPGNHDDAYGDGHLADCAALAAPMQTLAINLLNADGSPRFPASQVFQRGGLNVGVIGVFKPRDTNSLDLPETARAVAAEAARLEPSVELIVVVAHLGPGDCIEIAREAVNADIFVSGHTHQALHRPLQIEDTGALIVQAGSYAEYVGRLELVVDDETETIVRYEGSLVPMDHGTVPRDTGMQAWFRELERSLVPEAANPVTETTERVSHLDMAYLGAEGIRRLAGVDIAFCHASQIIRDSLPAGPVDVNAVFRTGGQRAYTLLEAELTGAQIEDYVAGLANTDWGRTHWSGFRGQYVRTGEGTAFHSNLDPVRTYSVAMSEKEWDTRFVRYYERSRPADSIATGYEPPATSKLDISFTDGVVSLLRQESDAPPRKLATQIQHKALHR